MFTLANGSRSKIIKTVKFHLKLLKFSWEHEFKILGAGPFPVILVLDFLTRTQLVIDVSLKRFSFWFCPGCVVEYFGWNAIPAGDLFLHNIVEGISQKPKEGSGANTRDEFPSVFDGSWYGELYSLYYGTDGFNARAFCAVRLCPAQARYFQEDGQ